VRGGQMVVRGKENPLTSGPIFNRQPFPLDDSECAAPVAAEWSTPSEFETRGGT
jgi:hypothetical protein